jgi:tetratricopeptide (TPR) repeat protein
MKVAYYSATATAANSNGNLEKAEGLYKKIIELEPKVAEHHWNLASIYISMRERRKVDQEIKILREMGRNDLADQIFLLLNQTAE